jgi:type II secretory pathway component GspD/PulD (secretin)
MRKALLLLSAFCLLPFVVFAQMPTWTSDTAAAFRSPFSVSRTRRVVNAIAAEVMLRLSYGELTDSALRKMPSLPGVQNVTSLQKRMPDGSTRVLEFGIGTAANGGQTIEVYGATITGAIAGPNPDFADVQQRVQASLQEQPLQPQGVPLQRGDLGHHIYQMSYVQGDRALGLLKALGYSTIEFQKSAGESAYESVFEPIRKGDMQLPVVIKLIDAAKTSLMDTFVAPTTQPTMPVIPQPSFPMQQQQRQPIPDIGGTFLHQITSGEPQQRLLILYRENEPESLEEVLSVLADTIDVPARQVVISALVVEINRDRFQELGITFRDSNGRATGEFKTDPQTGAALPFTFTFDENLARTALKLTAQLKALIEHGEAEILSNPSVLVLDGRQARIQIGQQVPVVNSTATAAGITSSVEYFPVGIVLNLRPRINDDGSEVTMQVETIVSAVASTSTVSSAVLFAPTVDNRQVQTFVRVADSTPFIIGGLIATDSKNNRSGIPLLSQIPFLGALFRQTTISRAKREVIVVLTPHVVPIEEKNFSYVIPKDSDIFDSSGNRLFRNAYRLRARDVYDLRFVHDSEVFQRMLRQVRAEVDQHPALRRTDPFAGLMRGEIPGESILVHRMLWEIVQRSGYTQHLSNERIILFEPRPDDPASTDFVLSFFNKKLEPLRKGTNAMVITFDAENRGTPDHPFVQPKATVTYENVTKESYEKRLIELNPRSPDGRPLKHSILISEEYPGRANPLDVLKGVIILKRLLSLNTNLPMTIKDFHVGRQIIFPTEEDIQQGFHVIDRDAAQLFFEVMQYYRAFEQEFNSQTQFMMRQLRMTGNSE